MSLFVDREEEMEALRKAVRTGGKVLLKGLRGVGKTALLLRLREEVGGVYVDFQRVLRPSHLSTFFEEETGVSIRFDDAYSCLEDFFVKAEEVGRPLMMDEFTELIVRFGAASPYRGAGGRDAVASHLRSLMQAVRIPVFLSATSLKTLSEVAGEYTKPLARAFDMVLTVHPLTLKSGRELAEKLAELMGVTVTGEAALRVAELTGGNPDYIRALTYVLPDDPTGEEVEEAFEESLKGGYFNALFTGLVRELSPSEVEVLHVLARGYNRYSQVEKLTAGINLNEALSSLIRRGLIVRVEFGRKDVRYMIVDKVLEGWLALTPFPALKQTPFKRLRVATLGFEALLRELFAFIRGEVEVVDQLGRKLTIPRVVNVYRYEGALGEVDVVAVTRKGAVAVEAYFGEKCPPEKLDQLERSMAITEKIEGKVLAGILASYFGFKEETLRKAEGKEGVFLLAERELNRMAVKAGYRPM
nr:hypothetical protein [Candidatus Freyrarchaeum guaymaensis]